MTEAVGFEVAGKAMGTLEYIAFLRAENRRLAWLIEWVNEHGSFTQSEWPVWEKLAASAAPWDEEGADL